MAGANRLVLHNRLDRRESPFQLARDARQGLTSSPKTLPPKYFYDARGSRLFEKITRLPEYYQTRAERTILVRLAPALIRRLKSTALIEFGSGSASKTRVLLDAMRTAGLLQGYGPVDVSEEASRRAAAELLAAYPELRVEGVIGDFEHPRDLPFPGRRRLLAFLGSTIGNLEPGEGTEFLRAVAAEMSPADAFLIGFDLVKDRAVLERAYNDAAGVTADFNLNMLRVLNRELGANFELSAFRHHAFYDVERARIEMHLASRERQVVRIRDLGLEVGFEPDETLRTELSYKYTRESAEALLSAGGLEPVLWETDPASLFALGLAVRAA